MKHFNSLSTSLHLASILIAAQVTAQNPTLQLSPSDYNGYNISCFGGRDGAIDLTVTGGSGLFSFHWSTGDTTEDLSNIVAGYYGVDVWEIINGIDSNYFRGEITLTEPAQLVMIAPIILQYPNGFGVSSDSACDGSVQINISGGVSPYSYQWNDSNTNQNRISLCSGQYSVLVTDNNGCGLSSEHFYISRPVNTNWTANGNTISLNTGENVYISGNVNADSIDLTSHLTSSTIRIKDSLEIGNSIWLGGASTGSDNRIYTDDTTLYIQCENARWYNTIFGDGNISDVGIGTPSPSARLHIYDNGMYPVGRDSPSSCEPLFKATYVIPDDPEDVSCYSRPRPIFIVEKIRKEGGIDPVFLINDEARVGIGTDTPSQKLEVNGNVRIVALANTGTSLVTASSTGVLGKILLSTAGFSQWINSGANIYFGSGSEKVGIGTSTFIRALNVNGGINLENNGIIQRGTYPITGTGDLGLYSMLAGYYMRFVTNGAPIRFFTDTTNGAGAGSHSVLSIESNGKIGIGTDSPSQKLEVAHNDSAGISGGIALNNLSSYNKNSEIKFKTNSTDLWALGNDVSHNGGRNFFIYDNVATSNNVRFYIDSVGRVGIGNIPPTTSSLYKLFVEGGVATRDVKVTAGTFPDYVFASDYKPISIYQLEDFLKINKHLPDMPSAQDVETNEGFELGNMQTKLLKKVEELTLYIIAQQKQIDELKKLAKK